MAEHPIEGLMETTMEKIRSMVDVNTIIGNPIVTADKTTIIPISSVSYGFASGGSDLPSKNTTDTKKFFGGGSGAGISIKPIAFLCVSSNGDIRMLNVNEEEGPAQKFAEMVPGVVEKISGVFKKNKKEKKEITDDKIEETTVESSAEDTKL